MKFLLYFQILVIFCGADVVKLAIIRGIYSQVGKDNLHRMILVLQNKMTAQARQATKEVFQFKVELFQVSFGKIIQHFLHPPCSTTSELHFIAFWSVKTRIIFICSMIEMPWNNFLFDSWMPFLVGITICWLLLVLPLILC